MNLSDQLTMFGELPPPEKSLDQYFTDPAVAAVFVRWCQEALKEGSSILEPSCGEGALVEPLQKAGHRVTAVEIDSVRASYVREIFDTKVICGNFLSPDVQNKLRVEGPFDAAVMNPPYRHNQDTLHILSALDFCHRVFAIVKLNFLASLHRFDLVWSKYTLARLAILVRRPVWICPDDWGARTDYCFVEIDQAPPMNPAAQDVLPQTEIRWIDVFKD
jgi:predicted RNA methylase